MNNKRKAYKIIVASLAMVMIACVAFGLIIHSSGIIANAEFVNSTIKEQYSVGETVDFPETATVKVNGEECNAAFKVIKTPDGSVVAKLSYTFASQGNYSAVYEYTLGGKSYTIEKNFKVVEGSWNITSTDSSVEYGQINTHSGATGLNLTISRGDTFTFSKPIKLSSDGPTDIITFFPELLKGTVPFVGYDHPEKAHHDANRVIVTLTDCYNPDISISMIMYFDSVPSNGVYVRTIATGQGEFGLRKDPPKRLNLPEVVIDGETYGYYKGEWGGSFFSAGADKNTTNVTWSFDATLNRVYISSGTPEKTQFTNLVNDLCNTDIAPGTFPGFTTGDVYVSLTVSEFVTNSTSFEIESIGDVRGEALKTEVYVDSVAPSIKIDARTENNMFIQKGKAFTLFDAKAYDNNLVGSVVKRVYYNYGTSMQSSVVLTGNKFTPVQRGVYTIEYSAKDSFGNVGVATVKVTVIDEAVMEFLVDKVTAAVAGNVVILPKYQTTSKNGDVIVKITAVNEKGEVEEINPITNVFTPKSVGKYTVSYTYTDGVDTQIFSYEMNVSANPDYGFIELPEIESIYIKNVAYQLEKINAYSFKGEIPVPVETTVYVSFDGGEYVKVDDINELYITGSSTVRFKYQASETSFYETESREIVDVGFDTTVNMQNYFKGDFTAAPDVNYIDFASNVTSGDNELKFINKLATALFSLNYAVPSSQNITSYDIILADENGNRIVLTHKMSGGNFCVSVNGGAEVALSGTIHDGAERQIAYDPATNQLLFSDNTTTVATRLNGEFGDYYTLSIALRGISGDAVLRIIRIQNQLICSDEWDYSDPEIYAERAKGYVEVNSEITVFSGVASDVLFPIADKDFTISVRCPDGTYAIDKNGLELKRVPANQSYTLILTQFGDYRVEYSTMDACGREGRSRYIITSADVTAPTLSFDDGSTAETTQIMKVGYKYNLKSFTVSDNDTANDEIVKHIFVYNSYGQLILAEKGEFTPTEEGIYTVYVYAFDKAGNSSYISYQINAVKS